MHPLFSSNTATPHQFPLLACILSGALIAIAGMGCTSVETKQERVASSDGAEPELPAWVQGQSSDKIPPSAVQVLFKTKLMEISSAGGVPSTESSQRTLDDSEYQKLIADYSKTKGSDLLSAPSVVTRSGQLAKVEIVQELVYPSGPEPGAPTKTANVGITVHHLGTVSPDQTMIEVKTLAEIVELDGSKKVGDDFEIPQLSRVHLGGEAKIKDGQTMVFTGSGGQKEETSVTQFLGIQVREESEVLERKLVLAVTATLLEPSGSIVE